MGRNDGRRSREMLSGQSQRSSAKLASFFCLYPSPANSLSLEPSLRPFLSSKPPHWPANMALEGCYLISLSHCSSLVVLFPRSQTRLTGVSFGHRSPRHKRDLPKCACHGGDGQRGRQSRSKNGLDSRKSSRVQPQEFLDRRAHV